MANPQKRRGDVFERKATALLVSLIDPALLVEKPDRLLGAGRRLDVGDLVVLPDVTIQVKAHNNYVGALWMAASGAARQATNGGQPLHVGMVPVPRARATTVNWLMSTLEWPAHVEPDEVAVFGTPARAVEHVRDDSLGVPRSRRLAVIRRATTPDVWIAPVEAWLAAYTQRLALFESCPVAI